MKNFILPLIVAFSPTVLFAGEKATITSVEPIYVNQYVDRYETECYNVRVQNNSDALTGALIGGVIGNQFGEGSGKDAMTVLGALIGANEASNKNYRVERQCEQVKRTVNEPVFSHYRIEYKFNGSFYYSETTRQYRVGDKLEVYPTIR